VEAEEELTARIEDGLTVPGAAEISAPFLPAFTSSSAGDRGVQAVLLYGSVLWKATRDKTSQPDFIVVVDSLSAGQIVFDRTVRFRSFRRIRVD